jgi:hypothetical protein
MDSPSKLTCPQCKSGLIYRLTNKPVKGVWTMPSRIWNCVKCLYQWQTNEEDG